MNACKLCGQPLAYPTALFCGAGCSARWEGGARPAKRVGSTGTISAADAIAAAEAQAARGERWSCNQCHESFVLAPPEGSHLIDVAPFECPECKVGLVTVSKSLVPAVRPRA